MKNNDFIWDKIEIPQVDKVEETTEEIILPKKKKKKKKYKKFLACLIVTIILFLLFFAPMFKVEEIVFTPTYFVTTEELEKSIGISKGQYYSIWDLTQENLSDDISDLVSSVVFSYDVKTNILNVEVTEIKPIAIDDEGNFYYESNGEVLTSTSLYYSVPKLIGFDDENEKLLVEALNTLDYKIIKEIVGIEYVPDEIVPDLVKMQMMDGNIVYITISEIENKMPYYLQMSQIIKQEATSVPGIIHLERGNYYEPI